VGMGRRARVVSSIWPKISILMPYGNIMRH
jgi:hypothetical protein